MIMKRIQLLLPGLFFMLVSCASVDKLVETGQYDAAIDKSVRKLAGKKKKQKYVIAAEEAFRKITKRDMDRISVLKNRGSTGDWEKIYSIAKSMTNRQQQIEPLLPLVDDIGYKAEFQFVNTDVILKDATEELSARYFDMAMDALLEGRNNNKSAAKAAYEYFGKAIKLKPDDRQLVDLRNEAEYLGITHVVVQFENESFEIMPHRVEEMLLSYPFTGRQSRWTQYYLSESDAPQVDFVTRVRIENIEISPEHVRETVHHFNRTVEETHIARDANGNALKDSVGNQIEVVIPVDVRAQVNEIVQLKEASMDIAVEIYDRTGDKLIRREYMNSSSLFENVARQLRGDRRAVEGRWLSGGQVLNFPSDTEMILLAAEELKEEIRNYINGFSFQQV